MNKDLKPLNIQDELNVAGLRIRLILLYYKNGAAFKIGVEIDVRQTKIIIGCGSNI
jgi:hypothetical protein